MVAFLGKIRRGSYWDKSVVSKILSIHLRHAYLQQSFDVVLGQHVSKIKKVRTRPKTTSKIKFKDPRFSQSTGIIRDIEIFNARVSLQCKNKCEKSVRLCKI